jgi:hypothetical protein
MRGLLLAVRAGRHRIPFEKRLSGRLQLLFDLFVDLGQMLVQPAAVLERLKLLRPVLLQMVPVLATPVYDIGHRRRLSRYLGRKRLAPP